MFSEEIPMSKTCQVSGVQATSKAWCSQCPMVCLGSAGKRRSCRRCQDTHIHSLRCERRRRSRNSRIALFMNDCLLPQLKGWLHRSCKDQCCQADGTPTFPGRSEEREWKRCKLYRQEMLVKCFFFFRFWMLTSCPDLSESIRVRLLTYRPVQCTRLNQDWGGPTKSCGASTCEGSPTRWVLIESNSACL